MEPLRCQCGKYFYKSLLRAGMTLSSVMSPRPVPFDHVSYDLHLAVLQRDEVKIKELLKAGASIDKIGTDGNAEIHTCVINAQSASIEILQELGANINRKNKNGNTPIHLAVLHNSVFTLDQLIEMKANIDLVNKKGNTALHEAIIKRNIKACLSLIDAGADVNIQNKDGDAPIHLTSMYDFEIIIDKLKEKKVDIDSINNRGNTALHLGIIRHQWKLCRLLIKNGANVNQVDAKQNNPLHLVLMHKKTAVNSQKHTSLVTPVHHSSTEAFKWLRESKRNSNRETPLHLAAAYRESFFKLLIQKGANIDGTNLKGRTPLHMAVYHCDLRMTVILMQNGANMHCIDMHRCSPLDVMMFLCTAHDVKTLSLRQEDCCREFRKLIAKGETVKVEDLLPTAKALFKFDILKNVKSSALFQKWFTKAIPRDLHQYLNDCVSEIKSMKSATIDENFSMYNFIMEDKNSDLSGSDCSEKVLECIFRHPTTIRFPIYCDAIIPKLEKDSLQQKLCEYKIYTTNQIEEIDLVNDVVAHLVQYLPKFDIFNLISAYSDGERTCQKKRKHSASILVKGDALPKNVKRKRH